jgi:hypothetical protein
MSLPRPCRLCQTAAGQCGCVCGGGGEAVRFVLLFFCWCGPMTIAQVFDDDDDDVSEHRFSGTLPCFAGAGSLEHVNMNGNALYVQLVCTCWPAFCEVGRRAARHVVTAAARDRAVLRGHSLRRARGGAEWRRGGVHRARTRGAAQRERCRCPHGRRALRERRCRELRWAGGLVAQHVRDGAVEAGRAAPGGLVATGTNSGAALAWDAPAFSGLKIVSYTVEGTATRGLPWT